MNYKTEWKVNKDVNIQWIDLLLLLLLLLITLTEMFSLLMPTGDVMHQQFNIQQLYALPTLYLFVLYLSENKQRLVPLSA
jgi:hypothetical protein